MDLDLTFLLQFGLVVVLLLILNPLLLRPMLQILELRHEKIHGMRQEIDRLSRQAAEDKETYETQMTAALKDAQKVREEYRVAGRDEERRILNETREDIAGLIGQAREEIRQAEKEAQKNLESEVDAFAKELMDKIVHRKGQAV
ncbi:MAG: ATP synthase F0 subunit B [Myxococcota bacterium]|jgi:F-type H+-transporting ATPase subunit b|nr:ATP synthase F0 subunit B [Myxococcota bacterium]